MLFIRLLQCLVKELYNSLNPISLKKKNYKNNLIILYLKLNIHDEKTVSW